MRRAGNLREGVTDQPLTARTPTREGAGGPGGGPDPAALNERARMKKIVALFALLAVLTACGGDDGGRPSTEDIAKALKDKDNAAGKAFGSSAASDQVIDCIAKAFHDSDLSDDALQAIVDGDEDYEGDKDDQAVVDDEDFQADVAKCITA